MSTATQEPITYTSELDPSWSPSPPPKGKAAHFIQHLIREKAHRFCGILRLVKPNFGLPKGVQPS